MYELTNPAEIKRLMKKYDKTFKKSLGQNFLINEEVLDGIVRCSSIGKDDCVLEIGPGIGVLTKKLALTGADVVAVEIDSTLLPILDETLHGLGNVTVINEDFMKLDLNEFVKERFGGKAFKVAANLPYYITTPILMRLLESGAPVLSVTVMVQKEVAKRLVAKHNTSDYGAISLAVQYRSVPEITRIVPADNFMPAPKVDSAVVKLTLTSEPTVKVPDEKLLFKLIKGGFALRRKTLVNSLCASGFAKQDVLSALECAGLPSNVRGEALSLENYASLCEWFYRQSKM